MLAYRKFKAMGKDEMHQREWVNKGGWQYYPEEVVGKEPNTWVLESVTKETTHCVCLQMNLTGE